METDQNNMILNNIQIPNENNITTDFPSHEVSLNENNQNQPEFDMLSKDKQTSNASAINLGQDNLFQNSSNVVDFSNQIGENLTQNILTIGGNPEASNINIENFNALGENISGAIPQTSGNVENLDFLKATSEQYPTEELPNINTPNIFTSKLLDDTKKFSSTGIVNPTNIFGDNNATYSFGKTEELNSVPLTENVITTPGDLNLQQNQILHSATTTTNIDPSINNSSINTPINIPTENLGSEIKTSNIPTVGEKLDLSDPKVIELMKKYPKIAELVKKYRTELVVEPKEEVKYIPVKRVRYVKKLKVYVPTIKKVVVPGKKIVVPIKKKVYVQRPKNVTSSQMTSQISTSTNPVMTTSSYVNPLSARTNTFNVSNINKMSQSINSINNSQLLGFQSINPSMSLGNTNIKPYNASTNVIEIPQSINPSMSLVNPNVKSYNSSSNFIQSINPSMSLVNPNLKSYNATSTKVLEIPLASSTSSSNIIQSSPIDLKTSTVKTFNINSSSNPRIYSRSLPKNRLNYLNNYNYY